MVRSRGWRLGFVACAALALVLGLSACASDGKEEAGDGMAASESTETAVSEPSAAEAEAAQLPEPQPKSESDMPAAGIESLPPAVESSVPPVMGPNAAVGSGKSVTRCVKTAVLNVRAKPDRFSKSVRTISKGEALQVEMMGGWARISDGEFVRSKHLTICGKAKAAPAKKKAGKKKKGQ
jgi:hypothetical protein